MEQQLAASKQHQRPAPLRLTLSATPFSRPNWSADDWHLRTSPHPPPPHYATISGTASAYGTDSSNLDEVAWHPMASHSLDEADFSTGPFPERRGEPNCLFYMRTGHCGFGMSCRYNHPPNRNLVAALAREKGEYPERVGQPECQYYLKTGTCKYGLTCKFHHPKDRAGYMGNTTVNILGYPLRLGERDCAYYMRTGLCKFGATCKFNHPQPAAVRGPVAMSGSPVYTSNGSSATPSAHTFPPGMPSWSMPRAPYMPRSRFQGPSNFAPLIVPPQNIVSVPAWGTYQARVGPQQSVLGGTSFMYGGGALNEAPSGGIPTTYSPYPPGSATPGGPSPAMQSTFMSSDSGFPERPGQLECQYYMRTGDCKFGMTCRFHHPKERASAVPNCVLSPLGLPLRPGVTPCSFYMHYGMCKFGATCKFDHPPTNSLTYSPSASSLTDMPVAPYPMGASVITPMPPGDSTIQVPILFHKRVTSTGDKQQTYEDSYLGSSAGESAVLSNARSGSEGSSGSSNADPVEMRGDSSQQAALNASSS